MESIAVLADLGLVESAASRHSRRGVLVGAGAVGAGLLVTSLPVPAAAAAASGGQGTTGGGFDTSPHTVPSGTNQLIPVPVGAKTLTVTAVGSRGGEFNSGGFFYAGGQGAVVTTVVTLPSGTTSITVVGGGMGANGPSRGCSCSRRRAGVLLTPSRSARPRRPVHHASQTSAAWQ